MGKDKFWFQIDTELLKKLVSYSTIDAGGFPPIKFNNSWNNYSDAHVWKNWCFNKLGGYDNIVSEYIHHIKEHSGYYVSLPSYYRSLFDILN